MHTNNIDMKKINSQLFKANLGNSGTFKALNSENKIQAHSVFKTPYEPCHRDNATVCASTSTGH